MTRAMMPEQFSLSVICNIVQLFYPIYVNQMNDNAFYLDSSCRHIIVSMLFNWRHSGFDGIGRT